MKILVLNGSPKGEKSNTLKVTQAFLNGMNDTGVNQVEMIHVSKSKVEHCKGCYGCWNKAPGKCLIKDDMEGIIQKYIQADLVIWSLPLYYFSMPSKIKAVMDRLLPINLPFIEKREDGEGKKFGHPGRYDLSNQQYMLISTCGFCGTEDNYEGLLEQFRILYGDKVQNILCAEGELFGIEYLRERTNDYLTMVEIAGREYGQMGQISQETREKLDELLFSQEKFLQFSAEHWGVSEDGKSVPDQDDTAYRFMKQMAAIYNPEPYEKDIILEMYFTDKDQTYQFVVQKDKCLVKKENFEPYTTRIETPLTLWQDIARGKVEGTVAMAEGRYKTLGEFSTMLKMDRFFSRTKKKEAIETTSSNYKASNMFILLLPFIALWLASLLTKIPLTAHYTCKDYGSERAFINPIFMKVNRILTCMWGIANVIMGFISYKGLTIHEGEMKN